MTGLLNGSFSVVAYAGTKLPENVATLIEQSDTIRDATSDIESYVAGIEVEAFQKPERDAFDERGSGLVAEIIKSDVLSKSQGDRQRDWSWHSEHDKEATQVLMPVCHVVFEYNSRSYDFWSDGADVSRYHADELPKDAARENEVLLGFLPFGVAALSCLATWLWISTLSIKDLTPFLIGITSISLATLAYGAIHRSSLLNYENSCAMPF